MKALKKLGKKFKNNLTPSSSNEVLNNVNVQANTENSYKYQVVEKKLTKFLLSAWRGDATSVRHNLNKNNNPVYLDKDYEQRTALHLASNKGHEDIIKILLEFNPNLNAVDSTGCTPLHKAIQLNHLESAKLLVDAHADVNIADHAGYLPLHYAAEFGDVDTVEILRDSDFSTKAKDGYKAVHIAAKNNNPTFLQALLDYISVDTVGPESRTPLMIAASLNHTECIKILLERNADTSFEDDNGLTAVQLAMNSNMLQAVDLLQSHSTDCVRSFRSDEECENHDEPIVSNHSEIKSESGKKVGWSDSDLFSSESAPKPSSKVRIKKADKGEESDLDVEDLPKDESKHVSSLRRSSNQSLPQDDFSNTFPSNDISLPDDNVKPTPTVHQNILFHDSNDDSSTKSEVIGTHSNVLPSAHTAASSFMEPISGASSDIEGSDVSGILPKDDPPSIPKRNFQLSEPPSSILKDPEFDAQDIWDDDDVDEVEEENGIKISKPNIVSTEFIEDVDSLPLSKCSSPAKSTKRDETEPNIAKSASEKDSESSHWDSISNINVNHLDSKSTKVANEEVDDFDDDTKWDSTEAVTTVRETPRSKNLHKVPDLPIADDVIDISEWDSTSVLPVEKSKSAVSQWDSTSAATKRTEQNGYDFSDSESSQGSSKKPGVDEKDMSAWDSTSAMPTETSKQKVSFQKPAVEEAPTIFDTSDIEEEPSLDEDLKLDLTGVDHSLESGPATKSDRKDTWGTSMSDSGDIETESEWEIANRIKKQQKQTTKFAPDDNKRLAKDNNTKFPTSSGEKQQRSTHVMSSTDDDFSINSDVSSTSTVTQSDYQPTQSFVTPRLQDISAKTPRAGIEIQNKFIEQNHALATESLERKSAELKLKSLKSEREELSNQVESLKKERNATTENQISLGNQLKTLQMDKERANDKLLEMEVTMRSKEDQINRLEDQCQQEILDKEESERKVRKLQQDLREANTRLKQMQQDVGSKHSRAAASPVPDDDTCNIDISYSKVYNTLPSPNANEDIIQSSKSDSLYQEAPSHVHNGLPPQNMIPNQKLPQKRRSENKPQSVETQNQFAEMDKDIKNKSEKVANLEKLLEASKSEKQELQKDIDSKALEIEKISQNFTEELSSMKQNFEARISELESRRQQTLDDLNRLQSEKEKSDAARENQISDINRMREELSEAVKNLAVTETKLNMISSERDSLKDDKARLQDDINSLRKRVFELESEKGKAEGTLKQVMDRVHSLENSRSYNTSQDNNSLHPEDSQEIASLSKSQRSMEEELSEERKKNLLLSANSAHLDNRLQEESVSKNDLRERLKTMEDKYDSAKSTIELDTLEKELEKETDARYKSQLDNRRLQIDNDALRTLPNDDLQAYKDQIEIQCRKELNEKLAAVNSYLEDHSKNHQEIERMKRGNEDLANRSAAQKIADLELEVSKMHQMYGVSMPRRVEVPPASTIDPEVLRLRELLDRERKQRESLEGKLDKMLEKGIDFQAQMAAKNQKLHLPNGRSSLQRTEYDAILDRVRRQLDQSISRHMGTTKLELEMFKPHAKVMP